MADPDDPCVPDRTKTRDGVLKRYFCDTPDDKAHKVIASEKSEPSCLEEPEAYLDRRDNTWDISARHDLAKWQGPHDRPAKCD